MRPRPTPLLSIAAPLATRLAAAACFLAIACSNASAGDSCTTLAACCASLSTEEASACDAALAGTSDSECASELTVLQGEGSCVPASSPTAPQTSQTPTCSQYVDCVGATDPTDQATILAAYGPSGTCWQSTATATECDSACAAGLAMALTGTTFNTACTFQCATAADCPAGLPDCNGGSCQACVGTGNDALCSYTVSPLTCPGGAVCNGACTNLLSDSNNCGSCGNTCNAVIIDVDGGDSADETAACVQGSCR